MAIVIATCVGCGGGGGTGGGADGGGATGGGATGGDGATGGGATGGDADGGGSGTTPTPCTLTISGDVTNGTYHTCFVSAAPQGTTTNTVQVDGFSLPGCNDCRLIADFSQTPTETCSGTGASVQVVDPSLFPDAIGMEANTSNSMASCTITTSQLDLAGHHWSGTIDAVVFATDANFNTVGYAHLMVTGGL